MNSHLYDRANEIFLAACDLDESERDAFLDEACRDDSRLRAKVRAMLDMDAQSCDAVEFAAAGGIGNLLAMNARAGDTGAAEMPKRLGEYALVRVIGEGGMGTVYEATQQHPQRTIALKVIRSGTSSGQLLDRFRREANLLGRLRHPGIAHIYDAGVGELQLPNGATIEQPYLAMELIDGPPLDVYVKQRALSERDKLELLIKVCDAVQHAHERGVIHRDLKPGNILVEADGQPKILDFGVSRATDADVHAVTMHTDVGQLVGTIAYMSPEQALGDPTQIDPRSDVYTLGVLGFELLSGRLPIAVRGQAIPEAARLIREEDPTRLASLHTRFRGDIDTMIQKALEKEPDRRYQTAGALADDLRRFLKSEPISAHPPSRIYQLMKFARRNRGLVAGMTAAAIVLLVGAIVSTSFAIQATRNARRADERAAQSRRASYLAAINAADAGLAAGDRRRARDALAAAPEEHRGWEWRLLAARAAQKNTIVDLSPWHTPHGSSRQSPWKAEAPLGRTPDGRFVALCSKGQTLTLVDLEAGEASWIATGPENLTQRALSPDARVAVALAHRSREVLVWDGLTGGRLWSWTVPGKPGDEALVQSIGPWPGTIGVALSAAGDRISVIVDGQNVVVLDAFSGRQIIQFPVQSAADTHSRAIPEVELASRHVADMLAPAFASESTVLWARIARIEWGEKLSECWELSHTTPSTFDATSTYLLRAPATQRHDWFAWIEGAQGIRLFNAKDGTAPRLLEGHWDHITRMAFSDDASLLFSVDAVHNVRVWETATGMCRHVLSLPDSMRAEDFQMMSDRPLHDRLDLPLAILPDEYGDRVCVATSRFATVFSWGDRNPLRLLGHESYVYFAAFSPDGARLATMAWGGDARLWNTANGELAGTIQAQDVSTNCTTFSRDGKHLFSWSNANGEIEAELRVFALDTLSLAESIQGQDAALRYLAGATPGATLTKGFEGAQLSQTDANGRVVAAAEWAADWLNVDGVSTAESDMVVVSADLTQALLGIRLPGVSDRPDAGMVTCAISRDGTLLAATPPSGSPIFLYDGWTGKPLGELPGHPARIFSMDFAPDNTRLATGGNDNVTRVWDVQHREQVLELRGHHRYVHAVRFSPDGSQLVTASGDRTVQLWDATLPTD